jgi:hypothetical protein
MSTRVFALSLLLLCALAGPVTAADDSSPHHMTKPDGALDNEKCGACHEADMTLSRSKVETCTLCHTMTPHAGSIEHLKALPTEVAARLKTVGPRTELPLAENGGMYCGTCHVFHDPALGTAWLPDRPAPRASAYAEAVRTSLEQQFTAMAQRSGAARPLATFRTTHTRALRLPVDDGSLCKACHGSTGP